MVKSRPFFLILTFLKNGEVPLHAIPPFSGGDIERLYPEKHLPNISAVNPASATDGLIK